MSRKRPRSNTTRFSVTALFDDLSGLANLKKGGCDFEFTLYGKERRSQAADRDGLVKYKPILMKVLLHAPNCYPNHMLLKAVWIELQKKFNIQSKEMGDMSLADWAEECTGTLRVMCRHVLDIYRSGTEFVCSDMKAMMELVHDDPSGASQVQVTAAVPAAVETLVSVPSSSVHPAQPRVLRKVPTDSSIEICSAVCNCPECRPTVAIQSESDTEVAIDPSVSAVMKKLQTQTTTQTQRSP